jgi:hypothetical protein
VRQQKKPQKIAPKEKNTNEKFIRDAEILQKTFGGTVKILPAKSGVNVQLKFKSNKEYTQFLEKLN